MHDLVVFTVSNLLSKYASL